MDLKSLLTMNPMDAGAAVAGEMRQRLERFFTSLIPTRLMTHWDSRRQPANLARTMDADRITDILAAAETGNTDDLFALYRDLMFDSHILAEFGKRLTAMLGDPINVKAADEARAEDVCLAKESAGMLSRCQDWFNAMKHLLSSCLWPVALVEKVWRPSSRPGLRFELAALKPVPAHLLNFTSGRLMICDTDAQGNKLGTFHEADPRRYIVHRGHLMPTDDNWGGPMRAILFWWLLKTQDLGWWARFLEKYQPIFVGKFNSGDDRSRLVLENAFGAAVKLGGLVINKDTEFDVKQSLQTGSLDGFERFYSICTREISKIITGHAFSQESPASGINSGEAAGKEIVRQDLRQLDSIQLGSTVKHQLFADFRLYNNFAGDLPEVWWGAESFEEAKTTADVLVAAGNAGLEPTDEAVAVLSKRLGFSLRRKVAATSPALGPLLAALSADALGGAARPHPGTAFVETVARENAGATAAAFRGVLAPVRRAILESSSASDLDQRIRLLFADWNEDRLGPILEAAQDAFKRVANRGASAGLASKN